MVLRACTSSISEMAAVYLASPLTSPTEGLTASSGILLDLYPPNGIIERWRSEAWSLNEILTWGLLGVFVSSCLLYLVPFMGPSTMVYAGAVAAMYHDQPPILIGIAVAAGASVAKAVHYYVSYFARKALSENNVRKLEGYSERWGRWKSVAIFVSSATPIPDEPVLVSLALVNYSPLRFLVVFLLGKLVVTIPGAYMGRSVRHVLYRMTGEVPMAIASIIFTIVTTIILLNVDLSKLFKRRTQERDRSESSNYRCCGYCV